MPLFYGQFSTIDREICTNANKVLIANSDLSLRAFRVFGPKIPVVALNVQQQSRLRKKTTDKHIVLVYTGASDPADVLVIEAKDDDVKVSATTREIVVNHAEYQRSGLHFLWSNRGSVRLPETSHNLTAILVDPTPHDLVTAGLLGYFMRSGSPNELCKRQHMTSGRTEYVPDYAKLYPSTKDI